MTPINIIYPPSIRSQSPSIRTNPFFNQLGSTKVYRKADEFDVDLEPDVIPESVQDYLNKEAEQNAKDVKDINKKEKPKVDWASLLNGIFGSSNSGSETTVPVPTNNKTPKEDKGSSKVWIYVGVGVGVLGLIGVIIAVVKSKK